MWGLNNVALPTPKRFGVLQDVSLDFNAASKTLIGQNNLPFAVARGVITTKGKASFGQFNGGVINDLFFGQTAANGQIVAIDNEVGTIPGTPFAVTVTNSATWQTDLGVVYAATGLPLTRVASGATPTTGQYKVSAGVYTFAAADTALGVYISYTHTISGSGQNFTIAQQAMGTTPTFKTVISLPYNNQKASVTLNACIANKFSFATKTEDFAIPSFDFEAFADSAGNLGNVSFAEVA
jgi:hypothetical protein